MSSATTVAAAAAWPDAKELHHGELQRRIERARYIVNRELVTAGHVIDPTRAYDEFGRPCFSLLSTSNLSNAAEEAELRKKLVDMCDWVEEHRVRGDIPCWELPANKKRAAQFIEQQQQKAKELSISCAHSPQQKNPMSSSPKVAAAAASRPKKEHWHGEDSDDERERLGSDHPDVKKREAAKRKSEKDRKRHLVQQELARSGYVFKEDQAQDEYGRPRTSFITASDFSDESKQNAKLLASENPADAPAQAELLKKFDEERKLHNRLADIVYGKTPSDEEHEKKKEKERKRHLVQKELEKAGHHFDPTRTYDDYGRPHFSLVSASDQSDEAKQNAKLLRSEDIADAPAKRKLLKKFSDERKLARRLDDIIYGDRLDYKQSTGVKIQAQKENPAWRPHESMAKVDAIMAQGDFIDEFERAEAKAASASSKPAKKRKTKADPEESGDEEEKQAKPKKAKVAKPAAEKKPKSEKKEKKEDNDEHEAEEEKPAKKPRVKRTPNMIVLSYLQSFEKASEKIRDEIPLFVEESHKKQANKYMSDNSVLIHLITGEDVRSGHTPHEIRMLARIAIPKIDKLIRAHQAQE